MGKAVARISTPIIDRTTSVVCNLGSKLNLAAASDKFDIVRLVFSDSLHFSFNYFSIHSTSAVIGCATPFGHK